MTGAVKGIGEGTFTGVGEGIGGGGASTASVNGWRGGGCWCLRVRDDGHSHGSESEFNMLFF